MLQVAESGAVKKLNVEGGVAAKARAVYAALFVPAAAAEPESNGSSSPKSPGSPRANGSSEANGSSSSSVKLMPAFTAAVPLLEQLASDPPGQLAQLVAMEWLLTVRWCVGMMHTVRLLIFAVAVFREACVLPACIIMSA